MRHLGLAIVVTAAMFASSSAASAQVPRVLNVTPGNSGNNGDVQVTNDVESTGNISVTPETGGPNSVSTVSFQSHADGTAAGVEAPDTVNVGSSATAAIQTVGGTVNIVATSSSATVTNNAPLNSGIITQVHLPTGSVVNVNPQTSYAYP